MTLQNHALEKIKPIGLNRLLNVLSKTAEKSEPKAAFCFENMYIYFSMIEDTVLNMESDFLDYKCRCEYILELLQSGINTFNEDVFNCLIEIYSYNLNYVANIKKLG